MFWNSVIWRPILVFDIILRGSRGPAGFTGMWRNLRVCQTTCTVWPWCLWPSPILRSTRTGAPLARFPLWSAGISIDICTNSDKQFSHAYTDFIMHRCIKLALVHDMAECIVGDIAPSDNISKAEKHRREEASATPTFADLMASYFYFPVFLFVLRKQWDTSQVFCRRSSSRRFMPCGR